MNKKILGTIFSIFLASLLIPIFILFIIQSTKIFNYYFQKYDLSQINYQFNLEYFHELFLYKMFFPILAILCVYSIINIITRKNKNSIHSTLIFSAWLITILCFIVFANIYANKKLGTFQSKQYEVALSQKRIQLILMFGWWITTWGLIYIIYIWIKEIWKLFRKKDSNEK